MEALWGRTGGLWGVGPSRSMVGAPWSATGVGGLVGIGVQGLTPGWEQRLGGVPLAACAGCAVSCRRWGLDIALKATGQGSPWGWGPVPQVTPIHPCHGMGSSTAGGTVPRPLKPLMEELTPSSTGIHTVVGLTVNCGTQGNRPLYRYM